MVDVVCGLCGIRFKDGSFSFTNQPDRPVHKDAVRTRVCLTAIEAQRIREKEGEKDLEPIALHKCINPTGKYNPKYRWIANPQEKV